MGFGRSVLSRASGPRSCWPGQRGRPRSSSSAGAAARTLETGALHAGTFHSEGWYVLAIVSAAFALATAILSLLRRWFSLAELAVGALFVPVALAALTTVMFPMAAMNFQWPALAGCIGAMAVAGLPRNGRMGLLRWLVAVVAAVPVVVVLTPLIEGVWLAMGLALAPVVAVLAALVFLQLLPLLDTLREPNWWWAPLAGLAIAGLFLAVGMSTASPSADRPAPLHARVCPGPGRPGPPIGAPTPPGTGRTRASRGRLRWPDRLARWGWRARPVRPLRPSPMRPSRPPPSLPPPNPPDLSPTSVPGAFAMPSPPEIRSTCLRRLCPSWRTAPFPSGLLRVTVTSEVGAEMMLFRFGEGGPRLAALNGRSLPGGGRPSRIEHWGTADGGVVLDFEQPAGVGEVRFTVVEHHLRPGELLGTDRFARPPELAPNIRMLSDRAMIRTVFSVDAGTGAVRIVTASEPAGAEEDAATEEEPVAAEADTVAGTEDSGEADTTAVRDSAEADTATAARDSTEVIQPDTVQPDTIRPDTIPADQVAADRSASALIRRQNVMTALHYVR